MEDRQFSKMEQWFVQLSQTLKEMNVRLDASATKQQLENRFDMLAVAMRNLHTGLTKLEERVNGLDTKVDGLDAKVSGLDSKFEEQKAEAVVYRLAYKRLEDEIEQLRSRVH